MRLVIVGGAVIVTTALVAVGLAVRRTEHQDPGEKVPQPHRAATAFPRPAAGQPRWAVPDHHWTALSKAWTDEGPGPYGSGGDTDSTRLVSDGKRAIAYEAGVVTAYDDGRGHPLVRRL
ncbi:hypothetical protein GCM10023196_079850 [Actinoallomurus vinaceus]|uniref:Uncharacterized protein n=2 Tax=Actinoallomurus vinaceus TaxID=1080074 RepID=A0ABP8UN04_9ACTN